MMRKTLAVLVLTFLVSFTLAYMSPNLVSAHQEDRGNLEAWIVLKAYDKNGKLLWTDAHRDPLTLNFARWLELYLMPTAGTTGVTDTGGTARSLKTGSVSYGYYPPYYNHNSVTIRIGSSSAAFGVNNYSLGNEIGHASASSPTLSVIGNSANISISASFTFSSPTTVSEVGIVTHFEDTGYFHSADFLIARDVLSTPKTVPAGGTLTVTWIMRINP